MRRLCRTEGADGSSASQRKYTMHCLADFPMAVVAFNRRCHRQFMEILGLKQENLRFSIQIAHNFVVDY